MSFTDGLRKSALPLPTIDTGALLRDGRPIDVLQTTRLHSSLIRRSITTGSELCVVNPTSKSEQISVIAADVLTATTGEERNMVFVMSSDTQIRERFRAFTPPGSPSDDSLSEIEWPIANVNTEGELSRVTGDLDGSVPRFLFTYTSKRIPTDIVGSRVACVLYDDTVKFTEERLAELRKWRNRNGIPAISYFTSDPLSDLFDIVSDQASVWCWPTELLREATETDRRRRDCLSLFDTGAKLQHKITRVGDQLRNRASGVSIEVHAPGGDTVEGLLRNVQSARFEFEKLVREMDEDTLWRARRSLRYAVRQIEELLSPLNIAEAHSRRSLSARVNQLERYASRIGSDSRASPAAGTYRDAVSEIRELADQWTDVPVGEKKEGQIASLLIEIADKGESVIIVTPTGNAAQSVVTYLQTEYRSLYEDFAESLQVHDAKSVRKTESADHAILYGAPPYNQRSLLRLAVAPHVVILAYPSELRLLKSQVESLNETFEEISRRSEWDLAVEVTEAACGGEMTPSPELVQVTVPDPETRSKSDLVQDVDLRKREAEEDLAELVRTFNPDYQTPSEDPVGDGENEVYTNHSSRITCTVLRVERGGKIYYRPNEQVSILRSDHGEIFTKKAEDVRSGDVILHFRDTELMRDSLYDLIRERGDAQLAFYASSWRVLLKRAIEDRNDELNDFIRQVEQHLDEDDQKTRVTYRNWYNQDVSRTRSKDSMLAIAEAYELEFVVENIDTVWSAVHQIENLYRKLREALEEHMLQAATSGEFEDVVVSESPEIRLSDFDVDRHLLRLTVESVNKEESVPGYKAGHAEL